MFIRYVNDFAKPTHKLLHVLRISDRKKKRKLLDSVIEIVCESFLFSFYLFNVSYNEILNSKFNTLRIGARPILGFVLFLYKIGQNTLTKSL